MLPDLATANAYHELRALWEQYLALKDEEARQRVAVAAQVFLDLHCQACGDVIDLFLRQREPPETICYTCMIPPFGTGIEPEGEKRTLRTLDGEEDIPF